MDGLLVGRRDELFDAEGVRYERMEDPADRIAELLAGETSVIFHLAAIVSGQAEQEFDLGMGLLGKASGK